MHVAGAPGFARRRTWRRRGAPLKGKEKEPRSSAAPWSLSEEGASETQARQKLRLSAVLLVLNLKPQKCTVLRGRVASCSDSRGDPSTLIPSQVPSSLPKSASGVQLLKSKTEDSLLSPFSAGTKFLGPSLPVLVSAVSSRGCGGLPLTPARVYSSWSPDFDF